MQACKRCESTRILNVNGKTSDMCFVRFNSVVIDSLEHDGYVPSGIGIGSGSGDYIEFDLCMECGQVQSKFPVPDSKIVATLRKP